MMTRLVPIGSLLLTLALSAGQVRAATPLSMCTSDLLRDFPLLEARAQQGDGEAQYVVGMALLQGTCRPSDHARGMALVRQAALGGHSSAAYFMGNVVTDGKDGAPPDPMGGAVWRLVGAFFWYNDGVHTATQFHSIEADVLRGFSEEDKATIRWEVVKVLHAIEARQVAAAQAPSKR